MSKSMSKAESGSLWSPEGIKLSLAELLAKIPDNDWEWRLYELYAVGIAPNGMSMPEFEQTLLAAEDGYPISWTALNALAHSLTDTHDCLLAATTEPVKYEQLAANDYSNCLALVEIIDDSRWEIVVF